MKHGMYRDGGTRFFTDLPFNEYFDKGAEICQDGRIGSKTKGEWYLDYPDKGRLLTEEEKEFVVSEIIAKIRREYENLKYTYHKLREK